MKASELKTGDMVKIIRVKSGAVTAKKGDTIEVKVEHGVISYLSNCSLSIARFDRSYVWELVQDESPISLLMKQLGVVNGEKFNMIDQNGHMVLYNPFVFNEQGYLIDSMGCKRTGAVAYLMCGEYTIEKIKPKSEAQLKLEKLEQQQREIADAIAEIRKEIAQ